MPVVLSWTSEPLLCSPFGWLASASPSAARLFEKVTSWLVPSRHSATVLPSKRGPDADIFSSSAHRKVQWSITTLCAPTVASASASHPLRFGRSEEHTSELQSLMRIPYAVFCLNKKTT